MVCKQWLVEGMGRALVVVHVSVHAKLEINVSPVTYKYKCKNISIKMLKDVGMTVPKIRETVYMQQNRG